MEWTRAAFRRSSRLRLLWKLHHQREITEKILLSACVLISSSQSLCPVIRPFCRWLWFACSTVDVFMMAWGCPRWSPKSLFSYSDSWRFLVRLGSLTLTRTPPLIRPPLHCERKCLEITAEISLLKACHFCVHVVWHLEIVTLTSAGLLTLEEVASKECEKDNRSQDFK